MIHTALEREPPLRLSYRLQLAGRGQGASVTASLAPGGERLSEGELKRILARLHPLDQAIVRELVSGTVFGQLGDAQLARLLPLLAQRPTRISEGDLRIEDPPLVPRADVTPGVASGLRVSLYLADRHGERLDLDDGRLLAGSQAFFVIGDRVRTIDSAAPWELGSWSRTPTVEIAGEIGPNQRDEIVRTLTRIGVPAGDLEMLAVRRAPPDRFVARLSARTEGDNLWVELALEVDYGGERAPLGARDSRVTYLLANGAQGARLIERDLEAEHEARRWLAAAGFRFDPARGVFVARGETALRAFDPRGGLFPDDWQVEVVGEAPRFHGDLAVTTRVRLLAERGLFELEVDVAPDDDTTARTLIDMKELLDWLSHGRQYVQLADGSYVAPSPHLRQSLRVLNDLGADSERVLVSPLCIGLLRALGERSALQAADEATQAWMDEVAHAAHPLPIAPPADLAGVLRDYQRRGIDWLMMLHRHRLTGILADDMGLGKTVQSLALLLLVREQQGGKPSLVVAPTSVLSVWRDEAARFTPGLRVVLYQGAPEQRRALDLESADLVVTSYGVLRRDTDVLAQKSFRYVILDEAQSAKNAATQNARAVRHLQSERRLALTGTPIENRPEELWATFDFLAPGFLGNLRSFRQRYARPIERGEEDATMLLRARVQPLVLRRLKSDVAKELPPKLESLVRTEMLPAQRALYDHVAGELRASVRAKIESVGIERSRMSILAALTRLRQICCDPALLPVPPGVRTPESAKLALFSELMREALESERRVVVFSQFVEMQKRLIAVLRKLGVEPLWLHGGTRRRDRVVAAFQDPNGPPVIVVSLKAGGTGVTLTRADVVMHYDPWWNPAVERQATDRTHRLGQTQQVTVYKLLCARSIEERVVEMAARKDDLADRLLAADRPGAKQITVDDILQLLS